MIHRILVILAWAWTIPTALAAQSGPEFHRAVHALHKQEIAKRAIRTQEEAGQYEGSAADKYSYTETRYLDATTGVLISRVRRDANNPELVHITEVNLYNGAGQLIRDYTSISMPWAPLQSVRTFINLHHYNGELHSFRQYDIDGAVNYESCEGTLQGKRVRLGIDGADITLELMATPTYQACFGGLKQTFAEYANPLNMP